MALLAAAALHGCAEYDNAYYVHSVWRPANGASTNARVFYLTDRKPDRYMPDGFDYAPGKGLNCGSIDATVPAARLPAHDAVFAAETSRRPFRCGEGDDALASAIAGAARASNCGSVLVYVHGFDTGFETAALRAAQLASDTQWRCAVAAFSWSSDGKRSAYADDVAHAQAAEPTFADFLCALGRDGLTVDIIAHSMGSRLVMESIAGRDCARAGQVVLAAPDIALSGKNDFAQLQKSDGAHMARLTVYASDEDVALAISRRMNGDIARLGDEPTLARRYAGPRTDVIDASDAPGEIWAHNSFNFSYEMLSDMALTLANVPAQARLHPSNGRDATLERDGSGYRLKVDWLREPDIFTRLFRWLAGLIAG